MRIGYAWEKLHSAALTLVGIGSIKERLHSAMASALIHLKQEDFPPDLQSRYAKIKDRLTRDEDTQGEKGRIYVTVNNMEDTEAKQCAEEIISLYDAITRHQKPFDD